MISLICNFSVSFVLQFFNILKGLEKGDPDVECGAALDDLSDGHAAFNLHASALPLYSASLGVI